MTSVNSDLDRSIIGSLSRLVLPLPVHYKNRGVAVGKH